MGKKITVQVAQELISHEAIVREAYRDSVNVWTWSVGITNSSGHRVYKRYLDNPQPLKKCLEIFLWVLQKKYRPGVIEVFDGHRLTDAQFAAALSFHYNTGGIRRASWAKLWKSGQVARARQAFMNWSSPPEIIPRRKKERNLFFDGTWTSGGTATEFPVRKPSYYPNFSKGKRVKIKPVLEEILG